MAPSPSTDHALGDVEQQTLLDLADDAIRAGLGGGRRLPPPSTSLTGVLAERRGVFVTLHVRGELNGCIGRLEPDQPLGELVPRLAHESAFGDPRLPALQPEQYADLHIEISALSALEPLTVVDRPDLIRQLRAGLDGLLIRAFPYQATFLPAVWASVPEPETFVELLLLKAGLPPGHWPSGLHALRYTAQEFGRLTTPPAPTPGF